MCVQFLGEPLTSVFPNANFVAARLDADTALLARGYDAVCLFVNDCADAAAIAKLAECGVKTIAMRCAGFDRVDLEACAEHGITVTRVPAYSPQTVAEHALCMMLCLARCAKGLKGGDCNRAKGFNVTSADRC